MASVETANVGMFHQEDQVCFVETKGVVNRTHLASFLTDGCLDGADEGPVGSYLQANSTVSKM
jgi:hypothetical protein